MCAYNPMVQDRTGDYKAAGIQQAAAGIADGIRAYTQNRLMAGQAIAKFDAIRRTSPDIDRFLSDPSAPPDVSKAYNKLMKDGSVGVRDAAILSAFADTHESQKREAEAKQMRDQQQRIAQQTEQMNAMKLRDAQQQAETLARMKLLGQFNQGAGTGVLRPEVQQQMRGQLADPVKRFSAQTASSVGQLPSPNDVQQFLAQQGSRPPTMSVDSVLSQFPAEKFDSTMIPTGMPGQVQVRSVSPRAPASERVTPIAAGNQVLMVNPQGKVVGRESVDPAIPSGYERSGEGVKPIPGGPAEIDAKKAEMEANAMKEKQKQNALAQGTQVAVMLNAIDEIVPKIGKTTAGIGAVMGALPGTDAYNLAAKLDTLRANIGFQQLAQMRAASPTGGALGQVAVQELNFLQAALGNLDKWQSPTQLKETLGKIRNHVERWKQTLQGINPDKPDDLLKEADAIIGKKP